MAYIDTAKNEIEPLFETVIPIKPACDRCLDTEIWLTPRNEIAECPVGLTSWNGFNHPAQNKAAEIVERAARRQKELGNFILGFEFELARILTHFTKENPIKREKLDDFFYLDTNLSTNDMERKVKGMIESLRNEWLIPIGASKSKPYGYWIISDLEDYKEWYQSATAAPITQLSTIHKNARHNFPHFADQMQLELEEV